ncbi:MAG: dephospho-CoA kinase [Flavobacteriaceae bacterium]|nr:MAG: dephospho-CoA kinase [Flavobacteriaceae bacterium]
MIVVGLTGGIGSGKTTVLGMFEAKGITTYNADLEARKLMNTSAEIRTEIHTVFGSESYIGKELNRPYIASIVFADKEKLAALNAITHPRLHAHFKDFVKAATGAYIVYEAAILLESEGHKLCDYIITVTAATEKKINRIQLRDGMTVAEITARMNNQMSDTLRIAKSDFVIQNHTVLATQEQVNTLDVLLLDLSIAK